MGILWVLVGVGDFHQLLFSGFSRIVLGGTVVVLRCGVWLAVLELGPKVETLLSDAAAIHVSISPWSVWSVDAAAKTGLSGEVTTGYTRLSCLFFALIPPPDFCFFTDDDDDLSTWKSLSESDSHRITSESESDMA